MPGTPVPSLELGRHLEIIQIRSREHDEVCNSSAATYPQILIVAESTRDCAAVHREYLVLRKLHVQYFAVKWQQTFPHSDVQTNSRFRWSAVSVWKGHILETRRGHQGNKGGKVTRLPCGRWHTAAPDSLPKEDLRDIRESDSEKLFLLLACYLHTKWCQNGPHFNTATFFFCFQLNVIASCITWMG